MELSSARFELFSQKHVGLAWNFRVNPNSCANPLHYEYYLRLIAFEDMKEGRGTTHVFADDNAIHGFVTLRASSLIRTIDGTTKGDSALEIAELAVAESSERLGVGSLLIDFAFMIAADLNENSIGIRYIVLCADHASVDFYKKLNFSPVADFGEIPREGWNDDCVPMFIRLSP